MICTTVSAVTAASDNCIEDIPAPPLDNRDSGMTDGWPLRSFLELGAYTEAVRCTRAAVLISPCRTSCSRPMTPRRISRAAAGSWRPWLEPEPWPGMRSPASSCSSSGWSW
jgi:hypothetical protein